MFIFGGLKASVTISGTVATGLPQPSTTQAYKGYADSAALTTSYQTLLTPTATKTFYLQWILMSDVAAAGYVYLADNGTQKLYFTMQTTGQSPRIINFPTPIPFVTTCQWKVQNAGTIPLSFGGFEA